MALISNSSVAVQVQIVCKRGDSFSRTLRFWQDTAKTDPLDISAMTFRMNVMDGKTTKPVLSFGMGTGFTITDTNILTMSKTATEMQNLPVGNFEYDIEQNVAGVLADNATMLPDGNGGTIGEYDFLYNRIYVTKENLVDLQTEMIQMRASEQGGALWD